MSASGEVPVWVQAYVKGQRRAGAMLMGVRRRKERDKACERVLIDAAASLTARAADAIDAPSGHQAIALAEMAGAAVAVNAVVQHGSARLDITADAHLVAWLARRSAPCAGTLAPHLMAASDGDVRTLLYEGAVPELEARSRAGQAAHASWLVQPAYKITEAASFLAELNAAARARPAAVHEARAEAFNRELASAPASPSAVISAHAFAVHYLSGIHGSGEPALRQTMLRLVATYPPHERAALRAAKVAALLSDARGAQAANALLDHILLLLFPDDRADPSVRIGFARDSAMVLLLLLDTTASESGGLAASATPVAQPAAPSSSSAPTHAPEPDRRVDDDAVPDADARGSDALAAIAQDAERAILAAAAERQARYERAIDMGALADAVAIVSDAADDDDHEQAWLFLKDIASRHGEADPSQLVSIAAGVLGGIPLDSDGVFDGAGAGCFTILSPAPREAAAAVARVASRLLNVDDEGIEHPDGEEDPRASGAYTPNYLHPLTWCALGVEVSLDTKGTISAAMARTMLAILTDALVADHVPALITGRIPALRPQLARWDGDHY